MAQRNGYRERDGDAGAGTAELRISWQPKGSYFPGLLRGVKLVISDAHEGRRQRCSPHLVRCRVQFLRNVVAY
jgi:transposase-like protein